MLRTFFGLFLVAWVAGTAAPRAQDVGAAVQAVISAQIEAFRANDLDRAFEYASPAIRDTFRTPEQFAAMVRAGYPMVWRPAQVSFSVLKERGGYTVQEVLMTDQAGILHLLDFEMVPGPDGWRINAVFLRRPAGA